MPLTATADPGHHHFASDIVHFYMDNGDRRIRCGISRLALEVVLVRDIFLTRTARLHFLTVRERRSIPPVPMRFGLRTGMPTYHQAAWRV
jgi:hypothetical protein